MRLVRRCHTTSYALTARFEGRPIFRCSARIRGVQVTWVIVARAKEKRKNAKKRSAVKVPESHGSRSVRSRRVADLAAASTWRESVTSIPKNGGVSRRDRDVEDRASSIFRRYPVENEAPDGRMDGRTDGENPRTFNSRTWKRRTARVRVSRRASRTCVAVHTRIFCPFLHVYLFSPRR